ncbi:UPF0434 protein [Algimonas ampicilliniresistens]|jgi:uncharacterized protein YbaR (Trm112 family)|uniref:UPF0434 protein n=1 Tax=Algimonas ampicilliniresistens TaxID=1298735 RepID=A0ABQ5V8H0_9PROT|nr:Trm112 family protein [Algimonas ampicilliniresistens]GLQ23809.1 UPF0434 protein [Algimonas ampicilliniresistens]
MTDTLTAPVPIDPKMMGVLVCPKTRGPLVHDNETNELVSKKAGLAYPIRDGVPILLIERARTL